jgi:hypothetical protein
MLWKTQPTPSKAQPQRSHPGDFSVSQIMALFIALTLLISIPIWTHPLPPLSDYINHLARMQVIAELPNNRQLAAFYELNWQVIPNLAKYFSCPCLYSLFQAS